VALLGEALEALPQGASILRAELLARTGTELYYDEDTQQSGRLTREALVMAEHLGDRTVLAYVLTTRHFACQRPDVPPRTRLRLAERAIELSESVAPSDVLAFALQQRMMDLFELGHGEAFEETFGRFERVVTTLDQPFFHWLLSLLRGTRALLAGDVVAAETAANATLELGKSFGSPNAEAAYAGQIFAVRREQGRLAELEPVFAAAAKEHGALPVFRAAQAAVATAAGGSHRANQVLEHLMNLDLDDFPRDQNWIAVLGTLTPVALSADNKQRIRQLISMLRPYADRMIVVGQGATSHGAVSHHLGLLHGALGEKLAARANLEAAEEIHELARTPLWNRHTLEAREALQV
jgi:hypothetical protein